MAFPRPLRTIAVAMFAQCLGSVLLFCAALAVEDLRASAVLLASSGLLWWWELQSKDESRVSPAKLAGIALVLRLAALGVGTRYSDDVNRYVWEGAVILDGRSPFAYAPLDPTLAELAARHPRLHERVNHPEVAAAYPPLSQALGVLGAAWLPLGPRAGEWFLRLVFLTADLTLVWLLWRGERTRMAAWAWASCPLVALEFAGSAHLDALGILLLVCSLVLAGQRTRAVCAGLGGASKFIPLVSLLWSRQWIGWAIFGLVWLPLLLLEGGAADWGRGLGEYAERWAATSLVQGWLPLERSWFVATGLLAVAWIRWREADAVRGVCGVLAVWLVLTPVLHPWYALWILPVAALSGARAWLLLVALVPLFYWPVQGWRSEGVWVEPAWLVPCVGLPCALVWCRDSWHKRRA